VTSPAALFAPVRPIEPPPSPILATWWDYFDQHREHDMAGQVYSWTCSVCAATWVLQATGVYPDASREAIAYEIGYPNCVNAAYGLMDANCLVDMFARYGLHANVEWVDWERAVELCEYTTGCLNSTRWYHFVAVRGTRNDNLWVANSAPGYQGIWDDISYDTFQAWAGSWKFIWLER